MASSLVEVREISKTFLDVAALNDVNLAVEQGSIAALLGPNGAGKTTLVRIIATLVRPDAGRASVAGFDVVAEPFEVRARIGLTGQYAGLDEVLTGRANLWLIGRLAGLTRRAARAPNSCLKASISLRRLTVRFEPIRVACAVGSTSQRALWPVHCS